MARDTLVEAHSIDYVPLAERHGKVWHLWPIWFMGDAHLATLAVGVLGVVMGANFLWTAIAVTAGGAFGTFFMAFHSTQGPQLGLPQMIQSRPQFGYMGALLVWAVALIAYVGYNAFNQVLALQAVRQLAGSAAPPGPVVIVAFALLAAAIAAIGYDWIHRAQRWLAYLLLGTLTVFSVGAAFFVRLPPAQFDIHSFRAVPFVYQFFAAAAYQLSWSIYVSDYSRYLPQNVGVASSFWWTYLGAFIGGAWMMLVGTLAASLNPTLEVAAAVQAAADLVVPGLGWFLLFAGFLGLVTISTLNFYGASLTVLSIADSFYPLKSTVAKRLLSLALVTFAATWIALASSKQFVDSFGDLLNVLLYLFTPWTAINLVDFYYVRKSRYSVREIFNPNGIYGRWNWRGLVAYGLGFVAMIPFFSTGLYTGPVAHALGGADIAMLIGLPVSTLVYVYAYRGVDLGPEFRRAAAADHGLDPGFGDAERFDGDEIPSQFTAGSSVHSPRPVVSH
jgi:purine-cytosine permease-like protein